MQRRDLIVEGVAALIEPSQVTANDFLNQRLLNQRLVVLTLRQVGRNLEPVKGTPGITVCGNRETLARPIADDKVALAKPHFLIG